ncbi:MAG: hypothetical protein ACW99F_11965 [Candidatus Hodarchaeales archaeon]|jgi:hypothetical protein
MEDKYRVLPTKIARSRKIQVRQFEPEEIWIEYSIEVSDPKFSEMAVQEATQKAIAYLDAEEGKLKIADAEYTLEITPTGKELGIFRIKSSDDPKYENFIHLWFKTSEHEELYCGYLHKKDGTFTFKEDNIDQIEKIGIKEKDHFAIKRV